MPFCLKIALQLGNQRNTRSFAYLQQGHGTALDSVRKPWCRADRLRAGRFRTSRLYMRVRSFFISFASFRTTRDHTIDFRSTQDIMNFRARAHDRSLNLLKHKTNHNLNFMTNKTRNQTAVVENTGHTSKQLF